MRATPFGPTGARRHLRRLLPLAAPALLVGAFATGGSAVARPIVHPDGVDCDAHWQDLVPSKSSLPYIVAHGVPFGFSCSYYKDGFKYEPRDEKTRDPDLTGVTFAGKITVPAATAKALHLSSKVVASGSLTGPVPYTTGSEVLDTYRLKLKPAFKKALKDRRVAFIAMDFTIDAKLPGGPGFDQQGRPTTYPGGTAHVSNGDNDFKYIKASVWTPKCKTLGQNLATGCPGA